MERTITDEITSLRLGNGLALLESGVSYVGGYQGAPVSHLLDVLVSAKGFIAEIVTPLLDGPVLPASAAASVAAAREAALANPDG